MIRKIYLVHHTHTDIGYTDTIRNVLREHVRILDDVVALCRKHADKPDGLQYKWTVETTLVLDEYQKRSPKKFAQLLELARQGLVEITGLWAQSLSELPSVQELVHLVGKTLELGREQNFPVRAAMLTDIPIGAWALPEVLGNSGVRYLLNADNTIRTLAPYDRDLPPLFWWEGPGGKEKVLVWHLGLSVPEDPTKLKSLYPQYALGYFFVLWPMNGWYDPTKSKYLYDPIEKHFIDGEPSPKQCLNMARKGIDQLCRKLQDGGYPYDSILLQAGADNFGPDMQMCETVKKWNEQVGTPHVRIATASEFFVDMEKQYGRKIPAMRGNVSDPWSDHAATKAEEMARYREAMRNLRSAGRLQAMAMLGGESAGSQSTVHDAIQSLIMTSEHTYGLNTFGLHADIVAGKLTPEDTKFNRPKRSWIEKAKYSREAERTTKELCDAALASLANSVAQAQPGILVANTLDHARSRLIEIASVKGKSFSFPATDVPPGISWFPLPASAKSQDASKGSGAPNGKVGVIENDRYRVEVDPMRGGLKSVIDKRTNRELVDQTSKWQLNQVVVEQFTGFPDYKSGGGLARPRKRTFVTANKGSVQVRTLPWPGGPALRVTSKITSGLVPIHLETIIRLPSYADRVEFLNRVTREPSAAKEALYVAFPFAVADKGGKKNFVIRCEVAGAVLNMKEDRLPGSIGDFQAIQGSVAVDHAGGSILWASPDAPLVCLGGMHSMRWRGQQDEPDQPHLFSYPMHNTWPTNCPLWQTKSVELRYAIASSPKTSSPAEIVQFGRDFAEPLHAIITQAKKGKSPASSIRLDCEGATVEAVEPKANGTIRIILSDPNRSGGKAVLRFAGKRKVDDVVAHKLSDGEVGRSAYEPLHQNHDGETIVPLRRGGLTVVTARLK